MVIRNVKGALSIPPEQSGLWTSENEAFIKKNWKGQWSNFYTLMFCFLISYLLMYNSASIFILIPRVSEVSAPFTFDLQASLEVDIVAYGGTPL